MKYIADKVETGVLDLSKVPMSQLIQWAQESNSQRDKDILGSQIMYGENNE